MHYFFYPSLFVKYLNYFITVYLTAESMSLFLITWLTDWWPDWFGLRTLTYNQMRAFIYINVSVSGQVQQEENVSNTTDIFFFFKGHHL